jgi:hypothetical protein
MHPFKCLLTAGALLSYGFSVLSESSIINSTTAIVSNTRSKTTASGTIDSIILVLARDQTSGNMVTSGLRGYGIPYEILVVPREGAVLPTLNLTATTGNYGGFLILSELAFKYSAGWRSSLTRQQWGELYAYQSAFKVRMVRLDVYPGPDFGNLFSVLFSFCLADLSRYRDRLWLLWAERGAPLVLDQHNRLPQCWSQNWNVRVRRRLDFS